MLHYIGKSNSNFRELDVYYYRFILRKYMGQIIFIGFVLAIGALILSMINFISPSDLTKTTMLVIEARIQKYITQKGSLPDSLSDLPFIENKHNKITDGWGREIIYSVKNGQIKLISYGKDGKPGGKGRNADIIHSFVVSVQPTTAPPTCQKSQVAR